MLLLKDKFKFKNKNKDMVRKNRPTVDTEGS